MRVNNKLTASAFVFFLLAAAVSAQDTHQTKKTKPPQDSPAAQPKRTVFNKDFARLLMRAVEAIANKDGSKDAERHADDAKADALAEADMETDKAVRQNETISAKFGLALVDSAHVTFELSGSESDRHDFETCASSYKDAIRKALATEQVGDELNTVLPSDCGPKKK